jgi:membrane-bound PQQ-dependent dehydrogenase (glucose/quinate/shikimate family)
LTGRYKVTLRVTAALIGILGLPMAWYGAQLAIAGGTPYYLSAGVLMAASAVALWRARSIGFFVFAAVLLLTLGWAVYEAGNSFWLVGSRIWLIGLLSIWLCTPVVRRQIWGDDCPALFSLRTVQVGALASFATLAAMTVELVTDDVLEVPGDRQGTVLAPDEWRAYGSGRSGTRYAPHDQINATNVSDLEPAWEVNTGRIGRFSGTPIQVGDTLYLCTAQNVVIALDGDTGAERWRFDPQNETPPYNIFGNCRGVTYYRVPDEPIGERCAERIYTATTDSRLIALDRTTGSPCEDFGTGGQVSLLAGMGEVKPLYYMVTSPPTVASGGLVVGGLVLDNQEIEEPSGVVRSYDAVTGRLLWAWDIGREGETEMPPEGGYYTRGTPNVWSLTSADDELGLVYVPTGNATPDYFGGHRTEAMNRYASSVVAIDARTGLTRWHFQTAHNDIWDYDVPSQPTLLDLTLDGGERRAVIVPTKRGELFFLDRATGEPLTEVVERPVPQTDLPEERTSATQPFSTGMPSFAYPDVDERDMFGFTPFDQMACRKRFLELRWEGLMTPPSKEGTLFYPGPGGGMNWGSVAVDEARQLMVVNAMQLPFTVQMVPRDEDTFATKGEGEGGFEPGYGVGGPQRGTPYAAITAPFFSPLFVPCLRPPYGEISVVDLATQEVVWRRGMGFWQMGFPYQAGSIVTAGRLIFNGGVLDAQFRAIDTLTGEVLWQEALDRPSDATPMSYVSPATGRQYVLVTVPGDYRRPTTVEEMEQPQTAAAQDGGGRVIAYALP